MKGIMNPVESILWLPFIVLVFTTEMDTWRTVCLILFVVAIATYYQVKGWKTPAHRDPGGTR